MINVFEFNNIKTDSKYLMSILFQSIFMLKIQQIYCLKFKQIN